LEVVLSRKKMAFVFTTSIFKSYFFALIYSLGDFILVGRVPFVLIPDMWVHYYFYISYFDQIKFGLKLKTTFIRKNMLEMLYQIEPSP